MEPGTEGHHGGHKVAGAAAADPPRLWWCNADFDLTLAHGGGKIPAAILDAARRLEWDLWPALDPRDALLVSTPPPPGFREGLEAVGLAPPRFVTLEEAVSGPCTGVRFTPFGWNAAAVRHAQEFGARADVPDPDTVRRVNARDFGAELERSLAGDGATPVAVLDDVRGLDRWLAAAPPGRYVAKGRHGFAGIAQQRFALPVEGRGAPEAGGDAEARRLRDRLRRLHARHGGLCVEPWHDIIAEWGAVARVTRDGRTAPPRLHRLLTTPGGGFAGACTGPGVVPDAVAARLRAASARVGAALHAAGYHGPFAFDAYQHRTADGDRLRVPSDLNARLSMAAPLHGLATRLPGRTILFAQFPATSCGFPVRFATLRTGRDILSFYSASRRGFLLLTPQLSLPRFSVAFIGDDMTDVSTQQHAFVRTFARPGSVRS